VTFRENDCCQSHSSTTILLSASIQKPARNTIRSHLLDQLLIPSSSPCTSFIIAMLATRTINARSSLPHKIINSHMSNSASQHPFVNRQKKKVYTPKQKNIPILKDRPTYLPTYIPTQNPHHLQQKPYISTERVIHTYPFVENPYRGRGGGLTRMYIVAFIIA